MALRRRRCLLEPETRRMTPDARIEMHIYREPLSRLLGHGCAAIDEFSIAVRIDWHVIYASFSAASWYCSLLTVASPKVGF